MLIIKDKIQMFMTGYPTVSDKYNVAGGTLVGDEPAKFGDLVKSSATTGYYEVVSATNTIAAVTELKGFIVATNVKLDEAFGGDVVNVQPGEAFNLLVNGFIAVELAAGAKEAEILSNAACFVTAAGKVTTTGDAAKLGTAAIPNCVFTGMYEKRGGKVYAEIYVK